MAALKNYSPKSALAERFLFAINRLGLTGYRMLQDNIIPAQSTLTRIKKGDQEPSRQVVEKFCSKYNISISWLYSGSGEMLCDKKSTNIGVNGVDISMINKDNAHHNNLNVTNQDECTTTDETSFLKEKIRMLEKMVNDKDQEITFLRDMLSKKC